MVKICSMASIVNPSGFVLNQEQGMSKVFKDCVHLLPSPGVGRDASRSGFLKLRPCQFQEEPWKPIDRLLESNKCVKIDSMVKQPVLINTQVQDARPSIAENCTEPDKISCTGTGFEVKDLLSLVAEIYPSKDSTACTKQPLLTPYFDRLDGDEAQTIANPSSPPELQSLTFAPLKSPEKTNPNPSKKKKRKRNFRKVGRGFRNLHNKNVFHACESLLSLIANRRQHAKSAIRSLKTSGPELPNLLTQFSAGIAGTGLAVVFSVISRVASGRVPFCASKALNTGFGFGLVWLAWAVNGLRDTIISIRKNSSKNASAGADETGLREDERLMKVDSSVKEIYFRAATLMALAVLKLA